MIKENKKTDFFEKNPDILEGKIDELSWTFLERTKTFNYFNLIAEFEYNSIYLN